MSKHESALQTKLNEHLNTALADFARAYPETTTAIAERALQDATADAPAVLSQKEQAA